MQTIVDKDQIIRLLDEQFTTIADICTDFDEATWLLPTCLPGWTIKDNVAHVVGTEAMLLGRPTPQVDVSRFAHIRNPLAETNEMWIESMRPMDGAKVLDALRDVAHERVSALRAMSDEEFNAPSWTPAGNDTYGRFMRIRHYDCFLHTLDITEAAKVSDVVDDEHLQMALVEPISGLGYIVAKVAGLPKGTTVAIEMTGPISATYYVDYGERAKVVESLEGDPTAGIGLDAVLFLRLTGGRREAEQHLGEDIRLSGDTDLARQLATHLAYTI